MPYTKSKEYTFEKPETWWENPWWLDEKWIEDFELDRKLVFHKIEYLKTVFDKDWLKKYEGNPLGNIILRSTLYSKSIFNLTAILELSGWLQDLKNIAGIHNIIKSLKSSDMCFSAELELEIGFVFHESGYFIEFPIPKSKKGKTPDILVKKDNEIYSLECKKLKTSNFESFTNNIVNNISISLLELAKDENVTISFNLSSKIIDKLHTLYKNDDDTDLYIREVIKEVSDSCEKIHENSYKWLFSVNDEIGEGYLSKGYVREQTIINTPEIPDKFKYNRMFENGIKKALTQLENTGYNGLVVVHAKELPDYIYLKEKLNDLFHVERKYKQVVAVMVFPQQYFFSRTQPCIVCNKYSEVDFAKSKTADVIRKYHDPIWL